ncbi:hypothetical protein TBLA_0A00740 [Henningerozyma blattae CBS 6284]|uniref:Nucleolar pre-ribosomal-associated protein 1 C-terminal domain-containing protein n=1 Tax=Henningerozyma blattae (strain ATCC 34711 / CBS 6284 / DSM 70876 / NBRC 10599 / NRRL Y-10934 / UCD 77-7) TaxID=1071380 RepID=I2GUS3_HENB6|nr:hypothetical protein TBLA_0A00740 [Tetrapisispora blattae CBS 6284]CCH57875.1 hypothetical protein TBLA_0A00740 [Tetrapisispora blattae CBS 6284]
MKSSANSSSTVVSKNAYGGWNSSKNESMKFANSSYKEEVGILEKISSILEELEREGDSKDFQPLIKFLEKGFGAQIIQLWSYYAEVNLVAKLTSTTTIINNILTVLQNGTTDINILTYGDTLIHSIIIDYTKALYHGLQNTKTALCQGILSLLKTILNFNNNKHLVDFLSNFDLNSANFVNVLTPPKSELSQARTVVTKVNRTTRTIFIEFWIDLINLCPSQLRKDLLTENTKIMSAWLKYMDKVDCIEIMEITIDCFIKSILMEPLFKKMTKIKILNELTINKIHYFYKSNDKGLIKKINEFFTIYCTHPNFSVAFPDDCVWFTESPLNRNIPVNFTTSKQVDDKISDINNKDPKSSISSHGVPLIVNKKEFRVYNKLLFKVLKSFKPWEDESQAHIVISILNHVSELIPPYANLLASQGSHTPGMTSYWFGSTMIIGRMINLPIPSFIDKVETNMIPSADLVMENIFPSCLSKKFLTQALQDDCLIFRQLACQLIIFSFKKYETILKLYDRKGWTSSKLLLSNSFQSNIPDLNILLNSLNQSYTKKKDNLILILSLTVIFKYYSKFFPNFFSIHLPQSNVYTDLMKKETNFTGIEFAILDNFLQFQEFSPSQAKWWNSTESSNSLFVTLLKLSSSINTTNIMSTTISNLLSSLLKGTILFNNFQASQIDCLINSLQVITNQCNSTDENLNKIFKFIDQIISFCMKIPYKYVDISNNYNNVSPFIMCLMEQWKYVAKNFDSDLLVKWVLITLRNMVIIGESLDGIKRAIDDHLTGVSKKLVDVYLNFKNYEKKLFILNQDQYLLKDISTKSFFQHIMLSKYNELDNMNRIPTSVFDVSAIFFRLSIILEDELIEFNSSFKESVDNLLTLLTKMTLSNSSFKIMDKQFINNIFRNIEDPSTSSSMNKYLFIATALINIFQNLKLSDCQFITFVNNWLSTSLSNVDSTNPEIMPFLNATIKCLSPEDILPLLSKNLEFNNGEIFTSLQKVLYSSKNHIPYSLISKMLTINSPAIKQLVLAFVSSNRVDDFDSTTFLNTITTSDLNCDLLTSYLKSSYFSFDVFQPVLKKLDHSLPFLISAAINLPDIQDVDLDSIFHDTFNIVWRIFEENKDKLNNEYLQLFTKFSHFLTRDQKDVVLKYITAEYSHKYSKEAVSFVYLIQDFKDESVKKWLNKLILYITKYLVEASELSPSFAELLSSTMSLLKTVNIWNMVHKNILNAQLEAVLGSRWVSDNLVIKYITFIALSSTKEKLESTRILPILLNNEKTVFTIKENKSEASFFISTLIYCLFHLDPSNNSNTHIQLTILTCYSGSLSAKDRILLQLLEELETQLSTSWTNHIYNWDLLEEQDSETLELIGDVSLITKKPEGLILSLQKDKINNTVKNFPNIRIPVPIPTAQNIQESWNSFEKFHKEINRDSYFDTSKTYDPLFLLLLTVHNEELVSSSKDEHGQQIYLFHAKKFIASGIFQVAVVGLSTTGSLNQISFELLKQMMNTLETNDNFKESTILKIFLKKIINTILKSKNDMEKKHIIAPIVWRFTAKLTDLVVQSAANLHEPAYRWILNAPYVRKSDIPLLADLMGMNEKIDLLENYYQQLAWVLEGLEQGVQTRLDVDLLRGKGIIEWLANLLNLPNLSVRMRSMINHIFYNIQRIEDGASTLITRFASVSALEINYISTNSLLEQAKLIYERNMNNTKNLKKVLTMEEQVINVKELASGFTVIGKSQKRLRDWTSGDFENLTKRINR